MGCPGGKTSLFSYFLFIYLFGLWVGFFWGGLSCHPPGPLEMLPRCAACPAREGCRASSHSESSPGSSPKSIAISAYHELELHKKRLNWEASYQIVSILQRDKLSLPSVLGLVDHPEPQSALALWAAAGSSQLAQIRQEAQERPLLRGHTKFWEGWKRGAPLGPGNRAGKAYSR